MSVEQERTFQIETTASDDQQMYRQRLVQMFEKSPLPLGERLFNIGMYTRSSILVKFLVMSDIYLRVRDIPGQFLEFGTWWGQNLILLENLRAIHEPFNKQRVIVGFDTFDGYTELSDKDKPSEVWGENSYSTGLSYVDYLRELLEIHEGSNVLGQIRGCHRLIVGDVEKTAPKYFVDHPQTIVAFAYFDMGLYKPTKAALSAIKPHLVSGSVVLLDELTWSESPGEAVAFKEVFSRDEVRVEKCALYPSKTIVTIR
ncbi:class I SAM-dependent methyltransferase [Afipia massiliensis]|uniref:Class I SAM-dependent methyltransferase n=1 Tax=Afipia massiliensis TaxID=211460 RepID=A0A4U6BQW3_9BRAD|nr:TylF/MycF/NovP-related O-methyltransferase [Afipia massiliensis]TKT72907.1 class I SAM-dependent methyltransferase [Afipia massiliensis]